MMIRSLAVLSLAAGTTLAHDACTLDCPHSPDLGVGVRALPMPFEDLPQGLQDMLSRLEAQAAAGDEIPMMCVAPGTDPKVAAAFDAYLQEIWGGGPERYVLSGRWSNTALDGNTGPQGNPVTLTYSFLPDGAEIDTGQASDLFAWMNGLYGSFNVWQPIFQQALDEWTAVSGITYVYEPNDDGVPMNSGGSGGVSGVRGDVRIGAAFIDGNSGVLAYNYFPDSGDMVLDSADSFYNQLGGQSIRLRNVLSHEAGHGIGLSHVESSTDRFLMEPFIQTTFVGPQEDDQRGSGRGYGDYLENDDSFGTAIDLGSFNSGDTSTTLSRSIDDNGDLDYFEFTTSGSLDVEITLTPLGTTYNQGPQGGSQSSFNALTVSNLSFNVYDASTSLVTSVNATGAGSAENATVSLTGPGPHYVRIAGDADNIQRYDLELVFSGGAVCLADCDGNGALNVDDVDCWVAGFLAGDLGVADCDGNGSLNVDDVDCFVAAFLAGCP
ncbi:MAG: matrixin family metalloprotease [Phycisphaerales bacterium]